MSDEHPATRSRHTTRTAAPLVITLRTDSYECPHCGVMVVATDDLVTDLKICHECS